jgi:hypothetical protein
VIDARLERERAPQPREQMTASVAQGLQRVLDRLGDTSAGRV